MISNLKDDFNSSIKMLADMSNSYKYKNNDYLLFFSLGERDESLIITITEGFNYLWAKEIDYDDFQKIRKDLGFQGTYANFFQLFREAILMTNGHFKIEIQPNFDMDFTIYYKITKTATLTGLINIGSPMHFDQDKAMFRQFIKKTLMDLQNSKKKEAANLEKEVYELKEKLKAAEDRIVILSKNVPNVPQSLSQAVEDKNEDNKKKKAHGDLINPNLKKRKAVGAKIGGG